MFEVILSLVRKLLSLDGIPEVEFVGDINSISDESFRLSEIGGSKELWWKGLRALHERAITNQDLRAWALAEASSSVEHIPALLGPAQEHPTQVFDHCPWMPKGFLEEQDGIAYLEHLALGKNLLEEEDLEELRDLILKDFGPADPTAVEDPYGELLRQEAQSVDRNRRVEFVRTKEEDTTGRPCQSSPEDEETTRESWKTFPFPWAVPVGERVNARPDHPCLVMGRLPRIYAGPMEASSFKDLQRVYPREALPFRDWNHRWMVLVSPGKFNEAIGELQGFYPPEIEDQFADLDVGGHLQVYKRVHFSQDQERYFWFLCHQSEAVLGWFSRGVSEFLVDSWKAGYRHQEAGFVGLCEMDDPFGEIQLTVSKGLPSGSTWTKTSFSRKYKGIYRPRKSGDTIKTVVRVYPQSAPWLRSETLMRKMKPRRVVIDPVNTKNGLSHKAVVHF